MFTLGRCVPSRKRFFGLFKSVHNQEVFTNRGFPVAHIFAILQRNSKSKRRYAPHSVRPSLNVRDGQNGPGHKFVFRPGPGSKIFSLGDRGQTRLVPLMSTQCITKPLTRNRLDSLSFSYDVLKVHSVL
jgi:hypothetical protein